MIKGCNSPLFCREIPTDNLIVRCGEGDTVVEGQHQDRWALEKVTHEDYKLTSQSIPQYDLAVIKVESNFKLSTNVDTICLPTSHVDYCLVMIQMIVLPQDLVKTFMVGIS